MKISAEVKKVLLLLVINGCVAIVATPIFAATWPVPGYNNVGLVYGDYETTDFHPGVDIHASSNTPVHSTVAGRFRDRTVVYVETCDIRVGDAGDVYHSFSHVVNFRFPDNTLIGENVCIADVADFDPGGPDDRADHLHFEICDDTGLTRWDNPLDVISYTDNSTPLITVYSDGNYSAVNPFRLIGNVEKPDPETTSTWIVNGSIDIVAQIRDDNDAKTVAPDPGHTIYGGVYKIGYALKNLSSNEWVYGTISDPKWLVEFDGQIPQGDTAKFDAVYDPSSDYINNVFRYIVTNNTRPGHDDGDGLFEHLNEEAYWNTKQHSDKYWNEDDAPINAKAKFPDSEYSIYVRAEDKSSNAGGTTQTVIVDNFRPYVKKVSIKQSGETKYEVEWQEGTPTRTLNRISEKAVYNHSAATVTIEFSEPVQNVVVKAATSVTISGSLDPTKKIWTGTLRRSQIIISPLEYGVKTLTISAKDLADNLLDGNPKTIVEFNTTTEQLDNYEDEDCVDTHIGGKDQMHHFKIACTEGCRYHTFDPYSEECYYAPPYRWGQSFNKDETVIDPGTTTVVAQALTPIFYGTEVGDEIEAILLGAGAGGGQSVYHHGHPYMGACHPAWWLHGIRLYGYQLQSCQPPAKVFSFGDDNPFRYHPLYYYEVGEKRLDVYWVEYPPGSYVIDRIEGPVPNEDFHPTDGLEPPVQVDALLAAQSPPLSREDIDFWEVWLHTEVSGLAAQNCGYGTGNVDPPSLKIETKGVYDKTPPVEVTDLEATPTETPGEIALEWTAPGGDNKEGQVLTCDNNMVRYK